MHPCQSNRSELRGIVGITAYRTQTLLWTLCDPNQCGADQRLPLNQAIRSGDDRAIEQLLRAQANPIRADKGQEAPLQLAVRVGAPSYVRLLLQYRAVPLRPEDVYGSTASVNEKKEDLARVMYCVSLLMLVYSL